MVIKICHHNCSTHSGVPDAQPFRKTKHKIRMKHLIADIIVFSQKKIMALINSLLQPDGFKRTLQKKPFAHREIASPITTRTTWVPASNCQHLWVGVKLTGITHVYPINKKHGSLRRTNKCKRRDDHQRFLTTVFGIEQLQRKTDMTINNQKGQFFSLSYLLDIIIGKRGCINRAGNGLRRTEPSSFSPSPKKETTLIVATCLPGRGLSAFRSVCFSPSGLGPMTLSISPALIPCLEPPLIKDLTIL